MKKELLALSICLLLLIISFSGCVEEYTVTTEEIKEKFIQAANSLISYNYSSSVTISDVVTNVENDTGPLPANGSFYHNNSQEYTFNFNVDVSNRELMGKMNNASYYCSNNTLYHSYDNLTWHVSKSVNKWHSFSHLDGLLDFVSNESAVERLKDDFIEDVDCYVLKINRPLESLELNKTWMYLLFPARSAEISWHVLSGNDYNHDMQFWIEKDTFLLKKASFSISLFINETYYYGSIGNISMNRTSFFESELVFNNYNFEYDMEVPWQSYLDEAKASLGHLEYNNLDYGFGFNPPDDWTIEREPSSSYSGVMVYRDIFYLKNNLPSNLSFFMTKSLHANFSAFIASRMITVNFYEDYSLDPENFSLYHNSSTINGMNAYEFVYSAGLSDMMVKEIWVEKDGILLGVFIEGKADYYNLHISDIEQSLNSSLMIVYPYFFFDIT